MSDKVLVTGATGTLGKAVVEAVRGAGFAVLQAVRDTAKVSPQAEAIRFDYAEQSTIVPALDGVTALVLMAPRVMAVRLICSSLYSLRRRLRASSRSFSFQPMA